MPEESSTPAPLHDAPSRESVGAATPITRATADATDDAILRGIAEVAREHLDHEAELDAGQRLVEDLALDSIRLLTLAVEVENHFEVCLSEEDDQSIETVADLVAVVRRELEAQESLAGAVPGSAADGSRTP